MTVTKEIPTKSIERVSPLNFTTTLKMILELLDLEAEDDYGILKPTEHAFKTAMQLVVEAYEIMGSYFPKASNSTDDRGGIFLTWKNRDPQDKIILLCPAKPEKQAFIYRQKNKESAVDYQVSAVRLVHWLEWLKKA